MLVYFFDAKLLTFYLVTKKITDCITANPFNPSVSAKMVAWWKQFYPPNGWNCRCTAVQVRKSKYPMSDPELAMRRGLNCTDGAKRQIFRFNPGKSMRLFPERHPYLPKGCGDCDKRLNLAFKPNSEKCKACEEINRQKRITINRKKYEELKKNPDYKDVEFDPETGALKATHIGHNFDKKGGVYELQVQNAGYKAGHAVILENEKNGDVGQRFTEGLWDSKHFEVAGCETGSANNILRGLKHCASKRKTEVAVIVLPYTDFDKEIFETAINRFKGLKKLNDGQYLKFNKIICVHDQILVYTTDKT